jgi:hypothetical protein
LRARKKPLRFVSIARRLIAAHVRKESVAKSSRTSAYLLTINLLATSPKDCRLYSRDRAAPPAFWRRRFGRSASRRTPRLVVTGAEPRHECQQFPASATAVRTLRSGDPKDATIWRIARSVYLRMPGMRHVAHRGMQADYMARGRCLSKAGEGMSRAGHAGSAGRSDILASSVRWLAEARSRHRRAAQLGTTIMPQRGKIDSTKKNNSNV